MATLVDAREISSSVGSKAQSARIFWKTLGPTASTVCSWNRLLYRPIGSHWIRLDPIGMVGLRICLLCEVLKVIYLHTLSQIGSTGFPLFIKGGFPLFIKGGGGVGATPLPAILEHSVRTGLAYRSGEFHPIYL